MKRLIVNADDFGADEARNDGIVQGLAGGVITSASILANGPAFDDARRRIPFFCGAPVSWGLHLNLSEGRPIGPPLPGLTGPDGLFPGKAQAHRVLQSMGNRLLERAIRREIRAQLLVLHDAGIRVRHLDGHQHVHLLPAVTRIVLETAEAWDIPWIRIPAEPPPPRIAPGDRSLCLEAGYFSRLADRAGTRLPGFPLHTTDHFRGLYLKDRLTPARLRSLLETLPDGLTELMVHPGRAMDARTGNPFSAFSSDRRETELKVLLSHAFRRTLAKHDIGLIPFPEAPC